MSQTAIPGFEPGASFASTAHQRAMAHAHSCATDQHGTPPAFIAIIHGTFGGPPDLDPASSPEWNDLIQARRIITAEENALEVPWFAGGPAPADLVAHPMDAPLGHRATVALNPPGDPRGVLVAEFWRVLVEYYLLGWVSAAIWVGFSLQQISRLQRVGARSHPLLHPTCVPSERTAYRRTTTEIGEDPPCASFLTLLSREPRQIETFAALGSELGCVTGGPTR